MTDQKWLKVARSLIGTREVPGAGNNPKIMGWANRVTAKALGIAYTGDSVPWCGLFTAYCMAESSIAPPAIAIRAKAWAGWGQGLSHPCYGAVVVFDRKGGGHVGFYMGETATHLRVLGGNQGDKVSEIWMPKSDLIATRWPKEVPVPLTGRRMLKMDGASVGGSLS